MTAADHIRDEASSMGYASADSARQTEIRRTIAEAFGYSRQQVTSALRHTRPVGKPRKHPRCPTCGQAVTVSKKVVNG